MIEKSFLSKSYGLKKAVKNINIEILKGTSVGIIGRSGAGKSTLVDIILGLLKPKSGEVIIDGENIDKEKNIWQTQIGYVPQNIYLLDDTIKKNMIEFKKIKKIPYTINKKIDYNKLNVN